MLRTNYRNTVEILAAAANVVAGDEYDDLESVVAEGLRDIEVVRHGAAPTASYAASVKQHDEHLLKHLMGLFAAGVAAADVAVLVPTKKLLTDHARLLREEGLAIDVLEAWTGLDAA